MVKMLIPGKPISDIIYNLIKDILHLFLLMLNVTRTFSQKHNWKNAKQ